MNKTISVLIVIYNKELKNSSSLSSLIDSNCKIDNLLIVNNGPEKLDIEYQVNYGEIQNVQVLEYLTNRPLSLIYNEFLHHYNSDYYIILDDDTKINSYFIEYIYSLSAVDVELPKIISDYDGKVYYPILNKCILVESVDAIYGNVFSIGSGLVISKKVVEVFDREDVEIFDTRFALYGVDTSFFYKLNRFKKYFRISSSTTLVHGLSLASAEKWSDSKVIELMIDELLTFKFYRKYPSKLLIKLLFKYLSKFNFRMLYFSIKIYLQGCHPRSKLIKETRCNVSS